ncbi:NADH-dependent phenylglyoxylate dehydrogenase subunit gamma [Methanosarcinaceae archaeon Ag5]|uniref:pyruvate synthase n=1 Tax=Methanolapillus africanus TaxID=3028297 RepID=A0AAE4SFZ9_9EURY|nr:NADH-dependent phenylglyoxylate dehydrogenase subunit gamma [Methanosarcinaceae archaeon Ag5]
MKEIRIHGRGGQGSVTAAELLSIAAFSDGKYSQAFPAFGVERRGAPVQAFTRLDTMPIRIRSQIYEPDYVIVQDPTLLDVVNVTGGLKPTGALIINTKESASAFKNLDTKARILTVDATKIAIDIIGVPIVNTVLLGAFAAATGEVAVPSIQDAVRDRFSGEVGRKNAEAIQTAYDAVKKEMEE